MRTDDEFGMGIEGTRKRSFGEMHGDGWHGVTRDRIERLREEAEGARLARRVTRDRNSFGTRMRAWACALAVAVERRETWRVVWERLGERGRL